MRSHLLAVALALAPAPCLAAATPAPGLTSSIPADAPAAVRQTARATSVAVTAGTPIALHLVEALSSRSVKTGDTFALQATDDVVVQGMVVVRKGALGQGTIGVVDHAGGSGHSGALAMNFDWVYAVDGGKIRLAPTAQRAAESDRKGASSTATIVGIATFGIGGLFGHNLAHGREVTVAPTAPLTAFVGDNIHVTSSEAATADHFDR